MDAAQQYRDIKVAPPGEGISHYLVHRHMTLTL